MPQISLARGETAELVSLQSPPGFPGMVAPGQKPSPSVSQSGTQTPHPVIRTRQRPMTPSMSGIVQALVPPPVQLSVQTVQMPRKQASFSPVQPAWPAQV